MDFDLVPNNYKKENKCESMFETTDIDVMIERFNYQEGFKDGCKYAHDLVTAVIDIMLELTTGHYYDVGYLFQTAHYRIEQCDIEHYVDEHCNSNIDYDGTVEALCNLFKMEQPPLANKYEGDW